MEIDGPAVGMAGSLHLVPPARKKKDARGSAARPLLNLSPFQAVRRDFAFVVEAKTDAGEVVRAAWSADKKLIVDVSVFDVYEGEHMEEGKKSVAISVTLQPVKATLTEEQIDAVAQNVTIEVEKRTGGILRG